MQTSKTGFYLMISSIVLMAIACTSKASEAKKPEAPATSIPATLSVDVLIVSEASLDEQETVAGSIVANRNVDIMSELSRKVTAVLFTDGSYVTQGQALYKLDDSEIRARLRQLEAELNLARISEQRLQALLKTETVRQEEYDIALSKLQSLEAARDILEVELSRTHIRAPFSGRIGMTKVFSGTLVSPGMPLVNLQEQSPVKVEFTVPEKYLPLVKPGSRVRFSTELNGEAAEATVSSTEASVDMNSRNILVHALAANPKGLLKPGMSARVFFRTSAADEKAIRIPTDALIPGGNGYSVFVVRGGKASMTPVTISHRTDKEATIRSGLQNGDSVMISNLLRAAEGTPVTAVTIQ